MFLKLAKFFLFGTCAYTSNKFQKFCLYIFFLSLNFLFPNWRLHIVSLIGLIKSDGLHSNIFHVFLFILKFILLEFLYLFYKYLGAPFLWLTIAYLCLYPYFFKDWFMWFFGIIFFIFIFTILYQVPVDALSRPQNPYLLEFYKALKKNFFVPYLRLLLFQQLVYTSFVTFIFVLTQACILVFYYFWISLTLSEFPDTNIFLSLIWLWLIDIYFIIFFFLFFRFLFYFSRFWILVIHGFFYLVVNFFNSTKCNKSKKTLLDIYLEKNSLSFIMFRRNGKFDGIKCSNSKRIFFDFFESYLLSRYSNIDTVSFLFFKIVSVRGGSFNAKQAIRYVEALSDEEEIADEFEENILDIIEIDLPQDEDSFYDDWDDDYNDLEFYLDLETFLVSDLDDEKERNIGVFEVDEHGEIELDEYGNKKPGLFQEDSADIEVYTFGKPFWDSSGELRLLMVENFLQFSTLFELGSKRVVFSETYENVLDSMSDDGGDESVDDTTSLPYYDFDNFIASFNFNFVILFKSLLKQLSFESQKNFCFYFDPQSRRSYKIFLQPKKIMAYLIRSELFYNRRLADQYRLFFMKRFLNSLRNSIFSQFLDPYSLVTPGYSNSIYFQHNKRGYVAEKYEKRWDNLVYDFSEIPNLRLILLVSDWKSYCKAILNGVFVDYYDVLNRFFFKYSEVQEDPLLKKAYVADTLSPFSVPLRKTLYLPIPSTSKFKKLFSTDAFFIDPNTGRKKFYMLEQSRYAFVDLNSKNFELDSFFFYSAAQIIPSLFYMFGSVFSTYRHGNTSINISTDLDSDFNSIKSLLGFENLSFFEIFEFFRDFSAENLNLSGFTPLVPFQRSSGFFSSFQLFRSELKSFDSTIFKDGLYRFVGTEFLNQLHKDDVIGKQLVPLNYFIYNNDFSTKVVDYTSLLHLSVLRKIPRETLKVFFSIPDSKKLSSYFILNTASLRLMTFFTRDNYVRERTSLRNDIRFTSDLNFSFYWERDYLSTFFDPNDNFDYMDILFGPNQFGPNSHLFKRFLALSSTELLYSGAVDNNSQIFLDKRFLEDKSFEESFYEYHWTHSADWQMPDLVWEPPAKWRPPTDWRPPIGWKGPSIYWIPPKIWDLPVWWKREWGLPLAWVSTKSQRLRVKRRRAYLDKFKEVRSR